MSWESALDLIKRVAKSEEWIDYLLVEMELQHSGYLKTNYNINAIFLMHYSEDEVGQTDSILKPNITILILDQNASH